MDPEQVEAKAKEAFDLVIALNKIGGGDTLIMAALFVPGKGIYYATQPLGQGHNFFRDNGLPGWEKKRTDFMHAETYAIMKAEQDGARPGELLYMAVYGRFRHGTPAHIKPCQASVDCSKMLADRKIGSNGATFGRASAPSPDSDAPPGPKTPSNPPSNAGSPSRAGSSSSGGSSHKVESSPKPESPAPKSSPPKRRDLLERDLQRRMDDIMARGEKILVARREQILVARYENLLRREAELAEREDSRLGREVQLYGYGGMSLQV